MLVMEELQKTYTAASVYRGIFMKAIQQIFPNYRPSTLLSTHATSPDRTSTDLPGSGNAEPFAAHTGQATNQEMETSFSDDFVDALMDQASLFNLWEYWNGV